MALAASLEAAHWHLDGEDVDRVIAELEERGYRLQSDADDDAILRAAGEAVRDAEARSLVPAQDLAALGDQIAFNLASAENPRSRQHREERSDGYSSWRCVPIHDIVDARNQLLDLLRAASPAPSASGDLRDDTGYVPGMAFGTGGNAIRPGERDGSATPEDRKGKGRGWRLGTGAKWR
jgi:hypothetical protein